MYFLNIPGLEITPWGFMIGPTDAAISLVIVTGQHGDEFAGQAAGTKMVQMILHHLKGSQLQVRDREGNWVKFEPHDISGLRILCAPGINTPGLQMGRRRYSDGENLNRMWPDKHHVVAPIWEAIQTLPGRVYVVDVHSTTASRDGDKIPDTHVFVTSACSNEILAAAPGMLIVPTEDGERETLEGESVIAGHWSCTLEISEMEPAPGLVGCRFLEGLLISLRLYSKYAEWYGCEFP